MSNINLANKNPRKVFRQIAVILSIPLLLFIFLLLEHTQMFPAIYLSDKNENELIEFSERILAAFDQDKNFIVVDKHGYVSRNRAWLTAIQLKMVDEMYCFCNKKGFGVIDADDRDQTVTFRHHIAFRYVIDYKYRNQAGIPEITTRRYQR